jgi:hypothetical protein
MRLPSDDFEALRAISQLVEKSMSQLVREAIGEAVVAYLRRSDIQTLIDRDLRKRQRSVDSLMSRAAGSKQRTLS